MLVQHVEGANCTTHNYATKSAHWYFVGVEALSIDYPHILHSPVLPWFAPYSIDVPYWADA